jgi:hypothetical protein
MTKTKFKLKTFALTDIMLNFYFFFLPKIGAKKFGIFQK